MKKILTETLHKSTQGATKILMIEGIGVKKWDKFIKNHVVCESRRVFCGLCKGLLPLLLLLSIAGCVTTSTKTISSPISQDRANRIIDGETTLLDVISMFGSPNSNPQYVDKKGVHQLPSVAHYRDCTLITESTAGFFSVGGDAREACKALTITFDDEQNLVIAHTYIHR